MNEKKPNIIKNKSFEFAISIVELYKLLNQTKKEFVLSKQLLRSGTSVGANIREALNAESKKDFIHKLAIAQKECDESIYWLELLVKTSYIDEDQFQDLHNKSTELLRILKSIIISSKQNLNS